MAYLEGGQGANGYAFSSSQAITTISASTTVFDVTGAGAGNAPAMIGANGLNTKLGFDMGAGQGAAEPQIMITLGVCTTVTGTLSFSIQVAADNGSYSPDTYYSIYTSPAFTGATQLYAGAQFILPVPPLPDGILGSGKLPRFYRVYYTTTASISVVASASLLIGAPTLRDATLYGANFPGGFGA